MLPRAPELTPTYDRRVSIPDDAHRTPPSERVAVVDLGCVGLPVAGEDAATLERVAAPPVGIGYWSQ